LADPGLAVCVEVVIDPNQSFNIDPCHGAVTQTVRIWTATERTRDPLRAARMKATDGPHGGSLDTLARSSAATADGSPSLLPM
jgi:hypothetical protein